MFKALFYPREVKFDTDYVHASMTNSMSGLDNLLEGCHYKRICSGQSGQTTDQTNETKDFDYFDFDIDIDIDIDIDNDIDVDFDTDIDTDIDIDIDIASNG